MGEKRGGVKEGRGERGEEEERSKMDKGKGVGVEEWMGQEYMWKSIDRVKRVKAPNPIHVYYDFINPLSWQFM